MKKTTLIIASVIAMSLGYTASGFCYGCLVGATCMSSNQCYGGQCICMRDRGYGTGKCVDVSVISTP